MRNEEKPCEEVWPFDAPVTQRIFSMLPNTDFAAAASVCGFFRNNAKKVASDILASQYSILAIPYCVEYKKYKFDRFPPAHLLKRIQEFNNEIFKPIATFQGPVGYRSDIIPDFQQHLITPSSGLFAQLGSIHNTPSCMLGIFSRQSSNNSEIYDVCQFIVDVDEGDCVNVKSVTVEEAKMRISGLLHQEDPWTSVQRTKFMLRLFYGTLIPKKGTFNALIDFADRMMEPPGSPSGSEPEDETEQAYNFN